MRNKSSFFSPPLFPPWRGERGYERALGIFATPRALPFFELLLLLLFARAKRKEAKEKPAGCTSGATPRGVGLKQKKLASLGQVSAFLRPRFPSTLHAPTMRPETYFQLPTMSYKLLVSRCSLAVSGECGSGPFLLLLPIGNKFLICGHLPNLCHLWCHAVQQVACHAVQRLSIVGQIFVIWGLRLLWRFLLLLESILWP